MRLFWRSSGATSTHYARRLAPPLRFEVLYRINVPEELHLAEYYHPSLEADHDTQRFFVQERHGWYEPHGGAKVELVTVNPENGFSTLAEAEDFYNAQVRHRASEG